MRYLFFFISFLYSFIFYLFYIFSQKKDIFLNSVESSYKIINLSFFDSIIFSNSDTIIIQSIFWNLIYEIIIFFIIGIFLFFYFSVFNDKEKEIIHEEVEKKQNHFNIVKILKNFSYYIWFLLFYSSLYLITTSFDFINFSTFIFIINILIYVIFFLSKFSRISKDFLRINSIIFSVFYIINYIYIIITDINYFHLVDFINSFLILLIFPTLLYYDKKIEKKDYFDNAILIHFSFYVFAVFLFYLYFYLLHQNLTFWISFISTFFWMIWFEILPKINFLKKDKITLRYIWISLTYIWIIFWITYLWFFDFSLIIFLILILQAIYNIFIHRKYVNYISLFLSIFLLIYLFYYFIIYFNVIDYKSMNFLILGLIISFLILIFTYIIKVKIFFSNYVIHFFSHLINIITIIIFFIFNNFELMNIWILLLLESIYFFLSYNKLNPVKKEDNRHDIHISGHH